MDDLMFDTERLCALPDEAGRQLGIGPADL